MLDYVNSKERLKEYFSTVIYIDDRFDHCIVSEPVDFEDKASEDAPPLPAFISGTTTMCFDQRAINKNREHDPIERNDMVENLNSILTILNKEKYKGVRLIPVLFNDETEEEVLIKKIQEAPLTLIDWKLGEKDEAFEIIEHLFNTTEQLKVLVVYTSSYEEAIVAMQSNKVFGDCMKVDTVYEKFSCYRCNNQSLLAIADKQLYNLEWFLEIIPELFIENYGIMPVAFLDYMTSVRNLSDKLFGAFCKPFESIYWLQMHFSELDDEDIPDMIASFIQNKFRESCSVNSALTKEFFDYQRNSLKRVIEQQDKNAMERIDLCWNALIPHLSGANKEFCDVCKEINYATFKNSCEQAIENSTNWKEFFEAFEPVLKEVRKKVAEYRCQKLFEPYSDIVISEDKKFEVEEHLERMERRIYKDMGGDYQQFKAQIFPIFIQSLISSPEILYGGVELVKNLKCKMYENDSLKEILYDGKDLSKKGKKKFLMNKIHFGDILVRNVNEDVEYLLCITPPCDAFRPHKTNLNINFIRGVELKDNDLNQPRKENAHISVLPFNEEDGKESLKYIEWQLFGLVNFDLNQESDYDCICSFSRPMMMSEQYARQIANKFMTYFSRAGVDELFMKTAENLRTIFSAKR